MLRFLKKGHRSRRTLIFASATHVWSDLFFALMVPLLILMKEDPELNLSFTEVGLLRGAHSAASAALQVPFGFLAERIGEFWMLLGGNIWVAASFVILAAASSFPMLLFVTVIGGLGGGTQHPLASSLVSRIYDRRGRSTAVGTLNFAGDPGKMAAPAVALILAIPYGWRITMRVVGMAGVAFMFLSVFARKSVHGGKPSPEQSEALVDKVGAARVAAFIDLSVVGFLDSAARAAALTFLPFLLREKGMGTEQIFVMLILLLAGGAIGKFVCGWLDERYGSVMLIWGTKGLTAVLLLVVYVIPTPVMAPMMVVLGIGLNGTSSVLYATVAKFVPPRLRARFYSFFYTTGEIAGAVSPFVFGFIADALNIRAAIVVLGLVTILILPTSLSLRKHLAQQPLATSREDP